MTAETRENEPADKVHVSVRVRPLNEKERGVGSAWLVTDSTVSHRVRLCTGFVRLDNQSINQSIDDDDERTFRRLDERIALDCLFCPFFSIYDAPRAFRPRERTDDRVDALPGEPI
jgi:hypothetical protein